MEIGIADIKLINDTITDCYGYNFSGYAQSSFKRRINRILDIHNHSDVNGLVKKLTSDKTYFANFLNELTVNTTEMFRDPSFWSYMKKSILPLFESKETINIWHAGCSSGEEVYTMAIILHEMGLLDQVSIYASDISGSILSKARKGVYPSRTMETNAENYESFGGLKKDFQQFFSKKGSDVEMDKSLIRNVQWLEHNLIQSKNPFQNFDIIICRNVMIYFSSILQSQVFKLFHTSLNENGVIGIGSKESFIWNSNINDYEQLSSEEKIFRLR